MCVCVLLISLYFMVGFPHVKYTQQTAKQTQSCSAFETSTVSFDTLRSVFRFFGASQLYVCVEFSQEVFVTS